MIGYIYLITNILNNKVYIGSTTKLPSRRWSEHKCAAFSNNSQYSIHQALRKHGKENFKFEILFCTRNIDNLEIIENDFITIYNSLNFKTGYNMIPSFYNRPLVSKIMKEQWANPIIRAKRMQIQKTVAESRQIPIVAINIYDGHIKEYISINNAIRQGFSGSCITESLKQRAKIGQEYVWFYKKDSDLSSYVLLAEKIIGGFKRDFLIPIEGWNNEGKRMYFESSLALRNTEFEPKAVRRVCKGERTKYKGFYWQYKTSLL